MKVVLQFRIGAGYRERALALAPDWMELAIVDEMDEAAFTAHMRDAEVIWHVLAPVTAQVMAGAPSLRLVQKIGTGVNTIDLAAATQRGIAVANLPGTNSQAVSELTLLLMLACLRRLPEADAATRAGNGWQWKQDVIDTAGEIHGRTVGLVGYGEVPRRLAPVLAAMGAKVIWCARSDKPGAVGERSSLPVLLAKSDIVSLHLPQDASTEKMIDARAIATMKPGAILVNTSRGGLVDEPALADALRSGRLAMAGVDVYTREPARENALFGVDNVVLAPHIAWLTPETLNRSLVVAIENCRRLKDGEELLHRVA